MNSFNQIMNQCEQHQPEQAENFARPEYNYWIGQSLGIYDEVDLGI
jgi:hypothetical protein